MVSFRIKDWKQPLTNNMKRILSIVVTLVAWGGIVHSQDLGLSAKSMDLSFLVGQKVEVVDSFYYRLDSTYTYINNGNEWVLDSKSSYVYDLSNNLRSYLFQFNESNVWKNGKKVVYSYAENNTVLQTQTLKWDDLTNDWAYVWRKSYQQDVNSEGLIVLYSEWEKDISKWTDKWQQNQEYNQEGRLIGYNTFTWNSINNMWENYWNYSCLYDDEGNLLELLNKSYDKTNETWGDEWQCIYEYNADGELSTHQIIDWDKESDSWKNIRAFSVSGSEDEAGLVEVREDWNVEMDDWNKSTKHSKIYNAKGYLTEEVYKKWEDTSGSWVENRLDTYSYNEDGVKIEEATFYWDQTSSKYENHLKSVYFYSVVAIEKLVDPEFPNGDFYLYPNPATDYVYISNLYEASLLTIYSVDGNALLEKQILSANESVNVSSLKKGVYVVTLKSESGIKTTKFIKN